MRARSHSAGRGGRSHSGMIASTALGGSGSAASSFGPTVTGRVCGPAMSGASSPGRLHRAGGSGGEHQHRGHRRARFYTLRGRERLGRVIPLARTAAGRGERLRRSASPHCAEFTVRRWCDDGRSPHSERAGALRRADQGSIPPRRTPGPNAPGGRVRAVAPGRDGHSSLRGKRSAKSSAMSRMVTNSTPSAARMCAMSRSSMRRFCGCPDTSGWIVMGNTA